MHQRFASLLIGVGACVAAALGSVPGTSAEAAPQVAAAVTSESQQSAAEVVSAAQPFALNVAMAQSAGVTPAALELALRAVSCAVHTGDIAPPPTLTLIDYSRPSTEPRLWVFDLRTGALRYRELVAHGQGTGGNLAEHFSDEMNSHQSSLGLFVTGDTYIGSNGYSLRLDGLEPGFNGRARERAIVMHGAPYVDGAMAAKQGRLGRSWGCPALRQAVARDVIDFVRDGGVIFSYYPDQDWLERSRYLNCDTADRNGIRQARRDAPSGGAPEGAPETQLSRSE